jgi:DNA-binding NarL/FixJ family response regulator
MPEMSLLIADDHLLVRETLTHFLASEPGLVVDTAGSLPEALARIAARGGFDVVLLDVMISGAVRRAFVDEAIALGARGFIPKNLPTRSLIHALRFVAAGNVFRPATHMAEEQQDFPAALRHLSPQEGRVLLLLCEGKSNKEIARVMTLSEVTIKTHMRAICTKLEARNRTHAAMIANAHLTR